MSVDTPSVSSVVPSEEQRDWRYLAGVGIVIAVLGVFAILAPFVTGVGLSILLGSLFVVGGLAHATHAFSGDGWAGSLWQIVLAVLYAAAGIALLANPVLGLASLTILLVAYLALEGVVEIVGGLSMRSDPQWGWIVASGVLSIVLAGLLWAGLPSTALWAVGLLVGTHLLSTGLALVLVGYLERGTTTLPGETLDGEPRSG